MQDALALGAATSTIAPLLPPAHDAPSARRSTCPASGADGERKLAIYNWSDYVAPDTIPNFEKEFGVEVTYDVYESNEEMLAKLLAGASGYDLVFPTGYAVEVLIAVGLAAPVVKQVVDELGKSRAAVRGSQLRPRQHLHRALAVGRDRLCVSDR